MLLGARILLSQRIASAQRELHIRDPLRGRYRPDDPSVNTLDGGVARLLRMYDSTRSPSHRMDLYFVSRPPGPLIGI
jgi:hypothetical protein